MKSFQAIFLVCSVILLGSIMPSRAQGGLDIDKMGRCFELGVKVASALGQNTVPTIRALAKCAKFVPMKRKGLDSIALLMLGYQFIQKIVSNQSCLMNTIQQTKNLLTPFAESFGKLRCLQP